MTDQPGNREAGTQQSPPAPSGATAAPESGVGTPQATAGESQPDTSTLSPSTTSPTTATRTSSSTGGLDSAPLDVEDGQSGEDDQGEGGEDDQGEGGEEERMASDEEFAREHDPAKHDVAAGEELRQRGDWTAEDAGGPQVWDAAGNLVEGTSPAQPVSDTGESDGLDGSGDGAAESGRVGVGRRTSSLDEVRDGGYSVGSAAPIDDGAMPLGHPVKAWEDTKTFMAPDDPGYDEGEPDLWFTDEAAARRARFGPAH